MAEKTKWSWHGEPMNGTFRAGAWFGATLGAFAVAIVTAVFRALFS